MKNGKNYLVDDAKYCYRGTNTLKNNLNLKDEIKLEKAEKFITDQRLMELEINPIEGNFDFSHIKKIHEKIFGDIYPFAGKIRNVRLSKGDSPEFCMPEYIEKEGNKIFENLKEKNYLKGYKKEKIIRELAELISNLIALHPFREGNGRTIREFIRNLCLYIGYEINFQKITPKKRLRAEISAFNFNYKDLIKILEDELVPIE